MVGDDVLGQTRALAECRPETLLVDLGSQPRSSVLDIVEEGYGCLPDGSQPRKEPATPVATVHQIYGLFRDGKPMPFLFQNSQIFLFLAIRIVGPVQARE